MRFSLWLAVICLLSVCTFAVIGSPDCCLAQIPTSASAGVLGAEPTRIDLGSYVPPPGTLYYDIYKGNMLSLRKRLQADPQLVNSPEPDTHLLPLHFAALYNCPQITSYLILHRANVNALHHTYATPLHLAARSGSLEVAKILVAHGTRLNTLDHDAGCTPLLVAVLNDHTQMAEFLIGKGADLKIKAKDGGDAFYDSCLTGNKPLVQFLLTKKVNLETANHSGVTALEAALLNEHAEIVALLLAKGADPNSRSGPESPLLLAYGLDSFDRAAIIHTLIKHGAVLRPGEVYQRFPAPA